MIKTIKVTNSYGQSLTFTLRSPEKSGFFIKSVDGLDPVKATINMTESLSLDGGRFNSARLNTRNIIMSIGLLTNPTIEDSRHTLYKYFPLKNEVKVVVETDTKTVQTYGRIESNEIDIFSKEESTLISILCPESFFTSLEDQVINFSSVVSSFTFPFSNESLVEKLIIFGNLLTTPTKNVYYDGDVPVGFQMHILISGAVGSFTIYKLETGDVMSLDADVIETLTGSSLDAGDEVYISTIKGNKRALLYRDGNEINILNALGKDTTWMELDRGDNTFYYSTDYGDNNLQFRIEYEELFEGI